MEAVHQQRSQQHIQNWVRIGRLFGHQFLEVLLPPCWAGRFPAFNGTFPRSNPTQAPQQGQRWAAPGGGSGAWRPCCRPYLGSRRRPRSRLMQLRPGMFLFYIPPPPESNLSYRGGGEVPYRWVRGGVTQDTQRIAKPYPRTNMKTTPPKS